MAKQDYYTIIGRIGTKPVQLTLGRNRDGDVRHRIDLIYKYAGEERRRQWYTRTQLALIHALLGEFLASEAADEGAAESADRATDNGAEPPF